MSTEKELFNLAVSDLRQLRELLARGIEDLDLVIAGSVPDDCPMDFIVKFLATTRSMCDSRFPAHLSIFAAIAAGCFNRAGLEDSALKRGIITPEEYERMRGRRRD